MNDNHALVSSMLRRICEVERANDSIDELDKVMVIDAALAVSALQGNTNMVRLLKEHGGKASSILLSCLFSHACTRLRGTDAIDFVQRLRVAEKSDDDLSMTSLSLHGDLYDPSSTAMVHTFLYDLLYMEERMELEQYPIPYYEPILAEEYALWKVATCESQSTESTLAMMNYLLGSSSRIRDIGKAIAVYYASEMGNLLAVTVDFKIELDNVIQPISTSQ
jgi:hypothetical protein